MRSLLSTLGIAVPPGHMYRPTTESSSFMEYDRRTGEFSVSMPETLGADLHLLSTANPLFPTESVNQAKDRTQDYLKRVNEALGTLDVIEPSGCEEWLYASLKTVFLSSCNIYASPPFLGIVLTSKYLKWPSELARLPALFMPLVAGEPGSSQVLPTHPHPESSTMDSTERLAFNMCPAISAAYIPRSTLSENLRPSERCITLAFRYSDLKVALEWYDRSLDGKSRLLRYWVNYDSKSGSDLFLANFLLPDLIETVNMPTVVGERGSNLVNLKLSLHCRRYLSRSNYYD